MNLAFPAPNQSVPADRSRGVTAVLGPTNTGKTHFAIERMLGHATGMIGLPLRLLAREVYNRVVERAGADAVALITGEEKIKPPRPRYWVATIEAMPRDIDVSFVAIDEIQLSADLDRGHVFTDRLLNRRGHDETLIIGALTMRQAVEQLLPGATIVSRPRLSKLSFAGERKLSRLPHRSAIVAFSAEEVYALAELLRRQRGGAAVVLGALSPRTRNAQVEMFQNGDVDYIVATDAIGMGLNLDVEHVAFAGDRKFDGWQYRRLNPAEFGQIAGRAGRHLRDGTFGTTGRCPPFDEDLVEALEDHRFDPVVTLQWRNSDIDFSSIRALQASLERLPTEAGLSRAPLAEDVMVLDIAARDESVQRAVKTRADVQRLWEACQIPDYRKISPSAHADFVLTIFGYVVRAGRIPDDWFSSQLAALDRIEGDIDALSARIAQVRTWTYIANRPDWLNDPVHWQRVARQVEDNLSDALHGRLTQRFVDRRTSVLMRRLRENAMLEAQVTTTGDVLVEGQHVGQLHGFRFTPDPLAAGEAAKALNAAAQKALASEIEARANKVHEAVDEAFVIANDGNIRWLGEPVAKLAVGEKVLAPRIRVLADEQLTGPALETVQHRLDLWLAQHMKKLLGPLLELEQGEGLEGIARGIAFQIAEALGVLERARVAEEVRGLDQMARAALRKLGVRFGAYHIYLAQLLKPAPRSLCAQLWALKHGANETAKGLDEVPFLAASGRTSFRADQEVPKGLYRAAGFRVCGERAVRVDILERLADLIRPAINYRPGITPGTPPPGAADRDGFVVTVAMTSLAGCSGEDFASILRSLGYVMDRRKGPAITVPLVPAAPMHPVAPTVPIEATATAAEPAPSEPDASAEGASEEAPVADASEGALQVEPAASAAGEGEETAPAREAEVPADGSEATAPLTGEGEEAAPAQSAESHGDVGEAAAPVAEEVVEPAAVAAPTHVEEEPAPPQDEAEAAGEPAAAAEISEVSVGPAEPGAQAAEASPVGEETAVAVEGDAAVEASDEPVAEGEPEPVEEVLIEIWRPRRHHPPANKRPERRPQRERGGHHGRPASSERPAEAPAEQTAAETAEASSVPAAEAPSAPPAERHERSQGQRDGRRRANESGPPNRHGRPERAEGGRPDRDRGPPGDRPRTGTENPRRDRHDNRPPREERSFANPERERSRERQPDPNSPFAKLAALKAQLESRAKEAKGDKNGKKD